MTTGEVHPETHFVLCDVGRALNPAIVEGQLVGAVIQGIGHATMEEFVYDSSGQLLTGTFMDYAMPTAAARPRGGASTRLTKPRRRRIRSA